MKLLIEIDKEVVKDIYESTYPNDRLVGAAIYAIRHGKPLDSVLDKIRAEIEPKCDRINSLASVLPYTAHREIQELLCEIMDLCKVESEDKE